MHVLVRLFYLCVPSQLPPTSLQSQVGEEHMCRLNCTQRTKFQPQTFCAKNPWVLESHWPASLLVLREAWCLSGGFTTTSVWSPSKWVLAPLTMDHTEHLGPAFVLFN